MTDAVTETLRQRRRLDRGYGAGIVLTIIGHLCLGSLVLALAGQAREVDLKVMPGIMLPGGAAGGGGEASAGEAKRPLVQKPVVPVRSGRLAEPTARTPTQSASGGTVSAPSGDASGGTSMSTPGAGAGAGASVSFGDPLGPVGPEAWYLTGVRSKIWTLWMREGLRCDAGPEVAFTILRDGSVGSVLVVQSAGLPILDRAAQRAVYSAGPFAPLPRDLEKDELRIRAVFKCGS